MTATEPEPVVLDTEDVLQAMLDRDPSDYQTRLVLADLLDERNDPRAAGYRALGRLKKRPAQGSWSDGRELWWWAYLPTRKSPEHLPLAWFRRVRGFGSHKMFKPLATYQTPANTRREVEDAAALAYRPKPTEQP